MTNEQLQQRNEAIKQSMKDTALKRQTQVAVVFSCKIQENKLSACQKEQLKMMFVEGKWLYNDFISFISKEGNEIKDYQIPKTVKHYNKDKNPIYTEFAYLHSQMKQSLIDKAKSSIKTLHTLKTKGYHVGKLQFKSEINSLHIKQISNLKFKGGNKIKLPNIKGTIKVSGLDQFINIKDIDYACADLINKPTGYYIHICCYIPKESNNRQHNGKTIGIDFGCQHTITTSEGKTYTCVIGESDKLKRLSHKLTKKHKYQKKGKMSNNYMRMRHKLNKEYQHLVNKKNDAANKIAHKLLENETIVMQDENLQGWKANGHGKKVQHSILGRIKSILMRHDNVVVLNQYAPTTKLCTHCGKEHTLPLSERTFTCECGIVEDRDIHAAKTMVWMYNNKICVGRTKLKHAEIENQIVSAIQAQTTHDTVGEA